MIKINLLLFISFLAVFAQAQSVDFVRGSVIDAKTEDPVEKVEFTIQNSDSTQFYEAISNSDGVFEFKNIPQGDYKLIVSDVDFNTQSYPFILAQKDITGYTFTQFPISPKVSWMFNWGDAYGYEHYWAHILAKVILIIYGFALVLVFFYSVLQLGLAFNYRKAKKLKKDVKPMPFNADKAPKVTIQLPMYNELYVAERIIEQVSKFDYPHDKLEIQVLDDSTDETVDVIAAKVAEVKAATGVNIKHIHRTDRTGYKAGALDAAMDECEGEFIAIFDVDFLPDLDWLKKTIQYFEDEKIGVVQTRWGHINKDYSLLTELQAFGLNGHFAIEQEGRNSVGHYINFNGTGGIWRKKCIEDADGWQHDTLTEDLDLSYRAQIKGWKFKYLEDVIAPAELPITMSALKAQQHRWMKGGAECFRKIGGKLVTSKGLRMGDRIHGLSHLFNSSVFIFILLIALLSLPVLHIKDSFSDLNWIIKFGSIFIVSTVFLMYYYWNSYRDKTSNGIKSFFSFVGRFFQFLIVSMGLSLNNTVAVAEGYLGIKSSFVRTPKFNVAKKGEFKGNKYDKKSLSLVTIGEGILFLVFTFTAINRAIYMDLGMVPFHLMLAIGFGLVFFYSVAELFVKAPQQEEDDTTENTVEAQAETINA